MASMTELQKHAEAMADAIYYLLEAAISTEEVFNPSYYEVPAEELANLREAMVAYDEWKEANA